MFFGDYVGCYGGGFGGGGDVLFLDDVDEIE